MLQFGKNIAAFNDQLTKITVADLYKLIQNPPNDILSRINQLRTLITIDEKKYRQLKTTLPYICCGIFNPAFRKTENFAAINHFIIDIDHLHDKDMNAHDLKARLLANESIELMFISPGNQGLKIMFRLNEKCFDHGKFSLFYKLFAKDFSDKNGLGQVIDMRTSDVTRACFVSHDPDALYREECLPINMQAYINFENNYEVKQADAMTRAYEKEIASTLPVMPKDDISADIFTEIRKKLNPHARVSPEKSIYVPEQLMPMMEKVSQGMAGLEIIVKSIDNISYGKKFVFEYKGKWAELNLFYGKRGFSVVNTPKRGSDSDLAEICQRVICEILYN